MSCVEDRLILRSSSTEGVELDQLSLDVEFGSDESVCPVGVDEVAMSEDFGMSRAVGSAEEDDGPLRWSLQVERPVFWKRQARRSGVDSWGMAFVTGLDVSAGALNEVSEPKVLEAVPDLGLPASIEAFDGRLKASFLGWSEDRNDVETEADANHSADRIGMLSGSGEPVVIVELGISRKAEHLPMFDQRSDDGLGGDAALGPGPGESAMQGNACQNAEVRPSLNRESFDRIKSIEFAVSLRHAGQIPALRRCRPASSHASIEETIS